MVIIGASGHAKVVLDLTKLNNIKVTSLFDDDATIQRLNELVVYSPIADVPIGTAVVFAIGNNMVRKQLADKYESLETIKLAHPKSVIDASVHIGEGSVVMASATINSATTIGKHCIINTSSSVDHDCELDDFVHISPGAVLCGSVKVGTGSHIGANAVVIQNIRIGKWVTIGAGSVILKDIPDYAVVVGNPGKIIKYNEK
tara:strand:- start:1064 stop:1666 length:603 start_codon:yes stop_codon:yes gene_type:complete